MASFSDPVDAVSGFGKFGVHQQHISETDVDEIGRLHKLGGSLGRDTRILNKSPRVLERVGLVIPCTHIDVLFLEVAGLLVIAIGDGIVRLSLVEFSVKKDIALVVRIVRSVGPDRTGQTRILCVAICVSLPRGPILPLIDHFRRDRTCTPAEAERIALLDVPVVV